MPRKILAGAFLLCHIKDHYPDSISANLIANEVEDEPE